MSSSTDSRRPSLTGIAGRADLVRALVDDDASIGQLAELLGLQRRPESAPVEAENNTPTSSSATGTPTTFVPHTQPDDGFAPVLLWQAVRSTELSPVPARDAVPEPIGDVSEEYIPQPVPVLPLARSAQLLNRIRRLSTVDRSTRRVDVERLVHDLSQARLPETVPRQIRKVWGESLHLVMDRSPRLVPYWKDQSQAWRDLKRLYPESGLRVTVRREGEVPELLPSCPVTIALTDFGVLRPDDVIRYGDEHSAAFESGGSSHSSLSRDRAEVSATLDPEVGLWLSYGRRLRREGILPVALLPCSLREIPDELTSVWQAIPWEPGTDEVPSESRDATVRRILCLLSYLTRVDPVLIRFVRRLLPECRHDPGVESLVWQSDLFESRPFEGAAFDRERANALETVRLREPADIRRDIARAHKWVRRGLFPGVRWWELLGMECEIDDRVVEEAEWQTAVSWFRQSRRQIQQAMLQTHGADLQTFWFQDALTQLTEQAMQRSSLAAELHEFYAQINAFQPNVSPLPTMTPQQMGGSDNPLRTLHCGIAGRHIVVCTEISELQASPVGMLSTRNGQLKLSWADEPVFWDGPQPTWARRWGHDRFGAYAEFEVSGVIQRMRWIDPGSILMGSTADEDGHLSCDGPQHEATVSRGFWIFDTPCTQSLWQAVTGKNPAHFDGKDRPVERVSWNDVNDFIRQLNEQSPGLALTLPPEKEWEFACRAGTSGPRYADSIDDVAWFADNSGSETHPVQQKQPNAWGLYDMLGNVLEWCVDDWRADYEADHDSATRVIRGGSWNYSARFVRAACRLWITPDYRLDYLGFRCVEFESSGPVPRGQRAGRASPRQAEPREDHEPASGGWLDLSERKRAAISLPRADALRLTSDVDVVDLRRFTKPVWATAIGRDRHGLWCRTDVHGVSLELRWIPPGRFVMGSPDSEEGRWDDEGPQHVVNMPVGFWMFATPCTQELWRAVMNDGPSHFEGERHPVETVSWNDCQTFCERLSGRFSGEIRFSLPRESQWEYACRAGTTTARYADRIDDIAWFDKNATGSTRPVGQKTPNSWGLYDMQGNVWEWCMDDWRADYAADHESANRVLRGGSWNSTARYARAACRLRSTPDSRDNDLGFRCVEFREELQSGQA